MDTIKDVILAVSLDKRPLPVAPDLRYEPKLVNDHGLLLNTAQKIQDQAKRGIPLPKKPEDLFAGLLQSAKSKFTGEGEDDRLGLFEEAMDAMSRAPPDDPLTRKANDIAISTLYQTLNHPPMSYIGTSKFREPDGRGNNPHMPLLGKAGEPYARSVQNATPVPAHELPEPGLVFDALLKRRYTGKEYETNIHGGGNSALTFAFASIVTHTLFRTDTDRRRSMINNTSSYLDLSPLYGCSREEQNDVRVVDGFGKLYPDCFSEERLLHLPPATPALLVIFNRNHNYIADMLYQINENGQWKDPATLSQPEKMRQDDHIFNTARLVNCGHFMSAVLNDYLAGFLGQTRQGTSWHLQPFNPIKRSDGTFVERGEGNHVSMEFNLLYRWHATISQNDEQWTEKSFSKEMGITNFETLSPWEFLAKSAEVLQRAEKDPKKRVFGDMQRGKDGRFPDDQLAKILQDATASPAQRYGARGTPAVLRPVEMLAMMQARQFGICTMNDFRQFLGLKKFDSFEEWNKNETIANAARQLYGHIDKLELYPGVQAEQNLEMLPGSGFQCGYTLMRAILCDAICLIRGDRFYTTDYTPGNLTAWGFQDCQPVEDNGAGGANLPKLIMRHLPNNYSYNSVFGLFPMFTPEAMRVNLTEQKVADKYDFERPTSVRTPKVVETLQGIRSVFNDNERFHVTYTENMKGLTQQYGFFLVFDKDAQHNADKAICMRALWPTPESLTEYAEFYKTTTAQLINEHSFRYDVTANSTYNGRYVDIVRNVINITSVRWAAEYLIGISLKNKQNPHGMFLETEVYDMLMVLFMCVFENVSPEHGWLLKDKAAGAGQLVNDAIARSLKQVMPGFSYLFDKAMAKLMPSLSIADKPCYGFLSRLAESGRPLKDLTACVIGLAVGSSVNYAQAAAQVVDFYLDDARAKERAHIVELVSRNDPESTNLLVGYIKEGQRLAPQFPGLLRECVAPEPVVIEQGNGKPPVTINPGELVWGSYYNAQTNEIDFPNPLTVDPERPRANYAVQGIGFHGCPGVAYAEKTLVEQIRVIFSLKNLRRAPGQQGTLSSFAQPQFGTKGKLYLDDTGNVSAWPGGLMVTWDD